MEPLSGYVSFKKVVSRLTQINELFIKSGVLTQLGRIILLSGQPDNQDNGGILGLHHEDAHFHALLIDYWNVKRGTAKIADRRDIDPSELVSRLPYLALIERKHQDDRIRYQYRLTGTGIARLAGRDPTNKYFDELYSGAYLNRAEALYDEVAKNKTPVMSRQRFKNHETQDELLYSRLILPLTRTSIDVKMYLLHIHPLEHKPGRNISLL